MLIIAALAVVLSVTDTSAAWLSPALVAVAVFVTWSGYGWISSPPSLGRALVLAAMLGFLTVVAWSTLAPEGQFRFRADTPWDYALPIAVIAAGMGALLWVAYLVGVLKENKLALQVRGWVGYALCVLLAITLLRYAWERVTADTSGTPAWAAWFASHEALQVGLVVLVVGALLLPLAELVSRKR